MDPKDFIRIESTNTDELALVHMVKIGVIRQLHADNLLNDKQYAELLMKNREEKLDNPACSQ